MNTNILIEMLKAFPNARIAVQNPQDRFSVYTIADVMTGDDNLVNIYLEYDEELSEQHIHKQIGKMNWWQKLILAFRV